MQGPLSTTFPIENRNVPVTMKALKNHLDRSKGLTFVKRISDFHLLLLLARVLDVSSDVPALAECVQTQTPVPEGYKILIESMASAAWCLVSTKTTGLRGLCVLIGLYWISLSITFRQRLSWQLKIRVIFISILLSANDVKLIKKLSNSMKMFALRSQRNISYKSRETCLLEMSFKIVRFIAIILGHSWSS